MNYKATLVRGKVYFLGNTRFDQGVPVVVTEAQKEYLEEHAIDEVTFAGKKGAQKETAVREKFEFEPISARSKEAVEGEEEEEDLDLDGDEDTEKPKAPTKKAPTKKAATKRAAAGE